MYDTDKKNNIILDLNYKKFNKEDINWEIYSREVLDSIELIEEFDEELNKDKIGINPFIEDVSLSYTMNKEDEPTLEKENIESWDYFRLKDLQKVAEYYEIPYKGKTKNKLIEKIIEFEEKEENCMKVYDREVNWNMMNNLSKDKFFSKFIINWDN